MPLEDIPRHDEISWRQLDNLERLGLLAYDCSLPVNIPAPEAPTEVRLSETPLGGAFMAACMPPADH
jgi:hypothetical protein